MVGNLRASAFVTVVSCACWPCWAQPTSRPSNRPTSQPAVDYVKDLFDDFTDARERARFFEAAGVDSELDAEEFKAAQGERDSFVRPFDRWDHATAFDKDRNGRLDWPEAEGYRQSVRDRVLIQFDKDKDGQLKGPERDVANAFLNAGLGQARFASTGGGESGGRSPDRGSGGQEGGDAATPAPAGGLQQRMAQFDKDGDGRLSEEERQGMMEEMRKEADRRMREWTARWDTDGDGTLSEEENQAMREELRKQAEERLRQWELQRYDANKDGQLDDQERAAAERERQRVQTEWQQRTQELIKPYDTDGDGQLSDDERRAMMEKMRENARQYISRMDADGDGNVSAEERQAWQKKMVEKYDADKDGQLNADERQRMIQEEGQAFFQTVSRPAQDAAAPAPEGQQSTQPARSGRRARGGGQRGRNQ